MTQRAQLETLRSLAFGSISGTYATVGTALSNPARILCITNNTEGDMFFSLDGVNDHLFIAAGNFKLLDVSANARPANQSDLVFETGTQIYVKQSEAPVSGSVYIECLY